MNKYQTIIDACNTLSPEEQKELLAFLTGNAKQSPPLKEITKKRNFLGREVKKHFYQRG